MVKPSVYAIDPDQKKAKDKAIEAGCVEVPINTTKGDDEVVVATEVPARRRGCCGGLARWQKITIVLVAAFLILGCVGFFTRRMLIRHGWCGTASVGKDWDRRKGDFNGHGFPFDDDWSDSHESYEKGGRGPHEHGSRESGDDDDDDDDHRHGPQHGPHHGPHHGPGPYPEPRPAHSHEHMSGSDSAEEPRLPDDDETLPAEEAK